MDPSLQTFRQLLAESPSFHGETGQSQWSLAPEVMEWLMQAVKPGDNTLETGCGYSTIIFALRGAQHTVISPVAAEHERIRHWGAAHGVDFSRTTFVADKSELVLPSLPGNTLDLVLIDGWHAFPAPVIDWFYTCEKLKVGGRVMVDDTQIRACRLLREFLDAEEPRWVLERRFHRTDVFRKATDQVFQGDWRSQPWGDKPFLTLADHYRTGLRPRLVTAAKMIPGAHRLLVKLRSLVSRKG